MSFNDDWLGAYIDGETGEVEEKPLNNNRSSSMQSVTIEDASSVSAKILVPQLGTDKAELAKGRVDVRRFSNIDEVEAIWLNWFMQIPDAQGGDWARRFCEGHLNLKYSIGGENKKLVVEMQKAISGLSDAPEAPKKKGILERLGLRKGEQ